MIIIFVYLNMSYSNISTTAVKKPHTVLSGDVDIRKLDEVMVSKICYIIAFCIAFSGKTEITI